MIYCFAGSVHWVWRVLVLCEGNIHIKTMLVRWSLSIDGYDDDRGDAGSRA